jgi:hypothetical protein
MNSPDDVCIIITGLLKPEYIDSLIFIYRNIKNKIISTWNDENIDFLNKLKQNNFIIILNEKPKIMHGYIYQSLHITNGCLKAKEMGFKYVLRFRSDCYVVNYNYNEDDKNLIKYVYSKNNNNVNYNKSLEYYSDDKLLKFICYTLQLYNKITFVAGEFCHNINVHPTDLIVFGPIDEIILMYTNVNILFSKMNDVYMNHDFSERVYVDCYFNKQFSSIEDYKGYIDKYITSFEEYKSKINSCIIECVFNDIDIIWRRNWGDVLLIKDHLINTQIRKHNFLVF